MEDEILSGLGGDDEPIEEDDELVGEDGLPKKEGLDGGIGEDGDDLGGEI